jgi:hypothetical protein
VEKTVGNAENRSIPKTEKNGKNTKKLDKKRPKNGKKTPVFQLFSKKG